MLNRPALFRFENDERRWVEEEFRQIVARTRCSAHVPFEEPADDQTTSRRRDSHRISKGCRWGRRSARRRPHARKRAGHSNLSGMDDSASRHAAWTEEYYAF